jgi:hypothetical protein
MDPINPIAPGPPRISPAAGLPVDPLERISRERDRPAKDARRQPHREPPPAPERDPDDDEPRHIDVRA